MPMKLDNKGNYSPWVQPQYGFDAEGNKVKPKRGYRIAKENSVIRGNFIVFDVYAGWIRSDGYQAKNKFHARSSGRWTTWARPKTK
jgi:hypothetical protein